ncbi:RNA polymerase sigma factor [Candidatus Uabimicrobium amorphum]|uniref:RNA polymerase sigma-70 region 2 domain-containing protein n=1 Tax=Uabimicrobium amorphum TaxID=2596890 RepID=A0A5S9F4J8_UABAM|nr:sigma-70 family RNA polymerase sigma factor [Candidatus Uabimicrobium amorphum]BBM84669.1 hypothetical protein UABAM_03030 [Candidatus Uabimicrobium amorphum]
MYDETQWSEIHKAAATDLDSPEKQAALNNILKRFEKPLLILFSKRLRDFHTQNSRNHHENTEEMLAEFYLYLLERRQKIFTNVDQNKGKLRTFLYTIAWRFANDYLGKQASQTPTFDHDFSLKEDNAPQIYDKYEVEYVNVLVNRALSRLKAYEKKIYHLFKKKYFSQPPLSSKEIALQLKILDPQQAQDGAAVTKAENNINKQLSRGRRMFFEFIREEVSATLVQQNEELLEEEMCMLRKHIGDISLAITH